jgi:hypothetical protein
MNLGPSMEQFGHTMGAQTRLDVEARHLGIFNRNFASWPECDFPVALGCSQDVLIETFEQGFLMSDYLRRYSAEDRRAASAAGRTVDADDELQVSHMLESAHGTLLLLLVVLRSSGCSCCALAVVTQQESVLIAGRSSCID